MLCCAIGVAAVATGAIGWRRFRRFFTWRLTAQTAPAVVIVAAVVVAMATIIAAGVVVDHLRHHAAYAGDGQTLLTDPSALPLCRGGSPADRTGTIASIEE